MAERAILQTRTSSISPLKKPLLAPLLGWPPIASASKVTGTASFEDDISMWPSSTTMATVAPTEHVTRCQFPSFTGELLATGGDPAASSTSPPNLVMYSFMASPRGLNAAARVVYSTLASAVLMYISTVNPGSEEKLSPST